MAGTQDYVPLSGSERAPLPEAREVGPADPTEEIFVTVVLRPDRQEDETKLGSEVASDDLASRRYLSRAELAQENPAPEAAVQQVEAFAAEHGLRVAGADRARRRVVLQGPVAAFNAAFRVDLRTFRSAAASYRGRTGPVQVPATLAARVEAVLGLDNRPQARPHVRVAGPARAAGGAIVPHAAPQPQAFLPSQIASLYGFPAGFDGTGVCVGIVEFNTPVDPQDPDSPVGAGFRQEDLDAYFAALGIAPPPVVAVSVAGGQNLPGVNLDVDVEVMLDIEVVAAVAPGARMVVYFAPNTSRGFVDAVSAAVHDQQNQPSVLSISWGGPEREAFTAQTRRSLERVLRDAARVGMTVLAASGDDGSSDRVDDGRAHTDYPAASPHVVGCGGTRITVDDDQLSDEVVWNDTAGGGGSGGGGVSEVYPLPSFQEGLGVPRSVNSHGNGRRGRGVPDWAGNASPRSGYLIRLNGGQQERVGGTSAVAPLYAGLVARISQALGSPLGLLNPLLYRLRDADGVFRDITSGDNGAYSAAPGWDACTGLGVPHGTALLDALQALQGGDAAQPAGL